MSTFFSKRSLLISSMVVFVLLGIASCKYQEMTEYVISKFIREDVAGHYVLSFRMLNWQFREHLFEYQEKSTGKPLYADEGWQKVAGYENNRQAWLAGFQRKLFSKALKPFYQANIDGWLDQLEYAMMEKAYTSEKRQQIFYVYALLAKECADYLDFALGEDGVTILSLNNSLVKITDEIQDLEERDLENYCVISRKADDFREAQKIEFRERKAKELGEEAQQGWADYQALEGAVRRLNQAEYSAILCRIFKLELMFGRLELAWPGVFGDVPELEERVEAYKKQLWEEAGYLYPLSRNLLPFSEKQEEETQWIEVAVTQYRKDLIQDHRESAAAKVGSAIADDWEAYQWQKSEIAKADAAWWAYRAKRDPLYEKMEVIEKQWPEIFQWGGSPEEKEAEAYEFQLKEAYAAEGAAIESRKKALSAEVDALHQKMHDLYVGHFEMEEHQCFGNCGLVYDMQKKWQEDSLYLVQWVERRRAKYGDNLLQAMRDICLDASVRLQERAGIAS